ncbi:Glutathione biosynthesis bifunctional protein gshF [Lachnospiraceae bacterium TWA4]|nr:Glutathione biosynthesis bifunctional protein gshF [Lachnospiraceae bacterium TWA4]
MQINNKKDILLKYLGEGEFGFEQEGLRVDESGRLSKTLHPFGEDKQIDRDFCENQVEIITGVSHSIDELYKEIVNLRGKVIHKLQSLDTGIEYLWPFSSPPTIESEDEIRVAQFTGPLSSKKTIKLFS